MKPKTFEEWFKIHYDINASDIYYFKLELYVSLRNPIEYYNNIINCDDFGTYFSIAVMDMIR